MTRKGVLNGISIITQEDDIVLIVGETLCKESIGIIDDALFIDNEFIDLFSIILGISLGTTKRVVLITEDSYLLRYYNSLLQLAVSNNINLILFTLVSNLYTVSVKQSTLFSSVRAMKGVFFNMGLLVHDYTPYLDTKTNIKKLKDIYRLTKGPVVGIVNIDNNRVYNKNKPLPKNNFSQFVKDINKEIEEQNSNKGDVIALESIIK